MNPLAPDGITRPDMIGAAIERLTSAQSGWQLLVILGTLCAGLVLLRLCTVRKRRQERRSGLDAHVGQQRTRTVSEQESSKPTPADIRARAIGTLGEGLVSAEIEKGGWPMLRNVILDLGGRTTEIDHLVKLPDGIVALEVKTYSGFISGQAAEPYWTQNLPTGAHKLINPVWQNDGHIQALHAFLKNERVRISGLVVSAGRARFAPEIAHLIVPLGQLRHAITGQIRSELADAAVAAAWLRLQTAASISQHLKDDHIRFVRSQRESQQIPPKTSIRPVFPVER